jgi:hypothetical protein
MHIPRCDVCGSALIEVIPFKTTQREIVEFALKSSLPESEKETIIKERWLHPGRYCPKGCTAILVEYGPLPLPDMSVQEAIAIAAQYSQQRHHEFIETQGATSRIVACVHCANFRGAALTDESPPALYHNPAYRPLRNHKLVTAHCAEPQIQELKHDWWYDVGDKQPECDYFRYEKSFAWAYKAVTGWSEYPA